MSKNYKTLVIWNHEYESLLPCLDIWQAKKQLAKQTVIIRSAKELAFLFGKQGGAKQGTVQTTGFENIYVLAELGWEDSEYFEGYNVLKNIMKEGRLAEGSLSLVICSNFNREELYQQATPFRPFIKMFPHQLIVGNKPKSISAVRLSEPKYRYLKYVTLQEAGTIDEWLHDLRYCSVSDNKANSKLNLLLAEFLENLDILGSSNDLLDAIYQLDKASKNQELNFLFWQEKKTIIINELTYLKTRNLQQTALESKLLKDFTLMLVEDDDEMRSKLTHWLQRHGAVVEGFHSGSLALERLKKSNSEREFHGLLVDLELLEENSIFHDEIQGIDLLEYCRNSRSGIVLRAITAYPKNTINQFMKGYRIIYKSEYEVSPLRDNELDIIKELKKEISEKQKNRATSGPKNGRVKDFYLDYYNQLEESGELQKIVTSVKKNAMEFFANKNEKVKIPASLGATMSNGREKWCSLKVFENVLTHRLIVLLQAKNGQEEQAIHFNYMRLAFNKKFHRVIRKQEETLRKHESTANTEAENNFFLLPVNPTAYLKTCLGFSGKNIRNESLVGYDEDAEECQVTIHLVDKAGQTELFKHELELLNELTKINDSERMKKYGF